MSGRGDACARRSRIHTALACPVRFVRDTSLSVRGPSTTYENLLPVTSPVVEPLLLVPRDTSLSEAFGILRVTSLVAHVRGSRSVGLETDGFIDIPAMSNVYGKANSSVMYFIKV